MSGFEADWLALREPADMRARNRDVADALQARFTTREKISVVDIGCGTGSNLRGAYELLPKSQSWTLVDYDDALLQAAREKLSDWADTSSEQGDKLKLEKNGHAIDVSFKQIDLAKDLEAALGDKADLITAAAFFDLASPEFIRAFAAAVASRRAAFYTVLTYNGRTSWQPRHPVDNAIAAAFHNHQSGDKGFGKAAGPTAPDHLADQFRIHDYYVTEGDSPWKLTPVDQALIDELHSGHGRAIREMGMVDENDVAKWLALKRTGAIVGHTDTLAIPG